MDIHEFLESSMLKDDKVLNYYSENPEKWFVKTNSSKPFIMAFAESYDSSWHLYKKSEEFIFPLYSGINGFYINETGILNLVIEYGSSFLLNIARILSLSSTVILLITIIVLKRRKLVH